MKNLNLHPIKKLEIILAGEHQAFVTDLLDRAGVKGYTIINNLSGKGSHGFHTGHVMFNEDDSLIMIIAAVSKELVAPILEGLAPFYNENSGVVFVSDIEVTRVVKFTDDSEPESEGAAEVGAVSEPVVEEEPEPGPEEEPEPEPEEEPEMDHEEPHSDPEPEEESEPELKLDSES